VVRRCRSRSCQLRRGAYSCPNGMDCSVAIPVMINGDSENVLDIVFVRGLNRNDETIASFIDAEAFVRDQVVRRIINDVFDVGDIERHRQKFNVYYTTNAGAPEVMDADVTIRTTFIFQANETTVDRRESIVTVGGSGLGNDPSGNFRHEGGHSLFALGDEYPCDTDVGRKTARAQPKIHGNLYSDLEQCTSHSVRPEKCRILSGAPGECRPMGNWSTSEPDEDVMWVMWGTYGPDCLVQRQQLMERIPCPGQGSVSCR
jgi:hypothetical protein